MHPPLENAGGSPHRLVDPDGYGVRVAHRQARAAEPGRQYNQQRIEKAARAVRDVGAAAGNVAAGTGRAVRNEVGDIDVDVDVRRKRQDAAGNSAEAR